MALFGQPRKEEPPVRPEPRIEPSPMVPPSPVPARAVEPPRPVEEMPMSINPPGKLSESVLAAALTIEGKIEGNGNIRVAGRFKGNVNVKGELTIEPGAAIEGEVKADTVYVGGEVRGHIVSKSRVELKESGTLIGDLKAGSLTVAAGSKMRGAQLLRDRRVPRDDVKEGSPVACNGAGDEAGCSAEAPAGAADSLIGVPGDLPVMQEEIASHAAQQRLAPGVVPIARAFERGAENTVAPSGESEPVGDAGHRTADGARPGRCRSRPRALRAQGRALRGGRERDADARARAPVQRQRSGLRERDGRAGRP